MNARPSRRRFLRASITAAAAVAVSGVRGGGDDRLPVIEEIGHDYFPMRVGYVWIYGSERGDVRFEVRGKDVIAGKECFAVRRAIGGDDEMFYLSVSDDGVRIHKVGNHVFEPPYREFAMPLREGAAWKWKGRFAGKDDEIHCSVTRMQRVTVPAGTFAAWVVDEKPASGGTNTFWLAEGVGVVRLFGKKNDLHNPTGEWFTWELKEFRRPARRRHTAV
jgi:hypothetical protein